MFDKIVTAEKIIAATMEAKGIFQYGNRSYDSLVTSANGATSVRRSKLGGYTVRKNTGDDYRSATRTKAKGDTNMVDTALDVYAVGIENEVAAKFESNDALLNEHIKRMSIALRREFDKDFCAAAMATDQVIQTKASGKLAWADLAAINKHFHKLEVDDVGNRITIVDADLEDQLMDIDVIKNAISFSMLKLGGKEKVIEVLGQTIIITALMEKYEGQPAVLGVHGEGLASIVSRFGEIEDAYYPTNLSRIYDMLAHAAFELDDNKFSVILKLKP